MSRLCLLICRVDEEHPDQLTQLKRLDLPASAASQHPPATTLDALEAETLSVGHQVMRCLLEEQWRELDAEATATYQRSFPPSHLPR
jgi:hypothetical protein